MEDLDSIVIGGGLAGAAAALVLSRGGQRVVLIERTATPQHKVCGDFLSGEATELLGQLGLDPLSFGAKSITQFRLISGSSVAATRLPFIGRALSRRQLDQAMLDLAISSGANVIRGNSAGSLQSQDGRVIVNIGDRHLTARTAVLATGKHAIRAYPRPAGRSTGFKQLFRADEDVSRGMSETVQLVAYDSGYLGAVMVEDGLISMAWLLRNEHLSTIGTQWEKQSFFLARQSPWLSEIMAGLTPIDTKPLAVSGIPYGFLRHEAIAANVYSVGDQLAVVPSLTGDGTSIALASGVIAAEAVLNGLDAQTYQTRLIKRLRWQFRVAGFMQSALESQLARQLFILAANSTPFLVNACIRSTRVRV